MKEKIYLENLVWDGYFNIIEVDHHIQSGEFITNVIAKWSCFGDGTINAGDKMRGDNIFEDTSTNVGNTKVELKLGE